MNHAPMPASLYTSVVPSVGSLVVPLLVLPSPDVVVEPDVVEPPVVVLPPFYSSFFAASPQMFGAVETVDPSVFVVFDYSHLSGSSLAPQILFNFLAWTRVLSLLESKAKAVPRTVRDKNK